MADDDLLLEASLPAPLIGGQVGRPEGAPAEAVDEDLGGQVGAARP